MRKNLLQRALLILSVTGICLYLTLIGYRQPTMKDFTSWSQVKTNLANNLKLGLDLKGGSQLLMQVRAEEVIAQVTTNNVEAAKTRLQKKGIAVANASSARPGQVSVTISDAARIQEAEKELRLDLDKQEWASSISGSTITFTLNETAAEAIREQSVTQAMTIIDNRVNAFGVAEQSLQRYGRQNTYQILLQLPGVDDPERVKKTLVLESKLELRPTDSPFQTYPSLDEAQKAAAGKKDSEGNEFEPLPYDERGDDETEAATPPATPDPAKPAVYVLIAKKNVITGGDIRDALALPADAAGHDYKINFRLKQAGAEKFKTWTGANIGKNLAIVLNNRVKSAPSIRSEISDSGEITGNFTKQSGEDLALVLRSGALPARVEYIEERTVGPSLGADSIRSGVLASVAGLIFIMIFMGIYYQFSGINAIVSLILNLIMLIAALAMFSATLTLPGIAGIILTIGMAVDSNVLIFERIREELKLGKAVVSAVETGFAKAFITIIDTHVTTIVSSVFLFIFGTGPIRGFAITLIIGLLANLFTATFVSRTMFGYTLSRKERVTSLSI
ncbi:MAG TPA: protein translocase subunit SecD [Acidobacteriota bacterium]|nr:protein translocase subunit SecD [Acidobacteriota bacterium]HNJ41844.1 protein translocase subunit SecD [Acidobacteriota bacterium]